MAPDRMEPVSIPATELEDAFTVSSMRVCSQFARSLHGELEVLGAVFVPSSQRMFIAYLEAQINEADAHGAGRCLWVAQMRSATDRLEHDIRRGVSLSRWDDQLRAFVAKVDGSLDRAGLGGPQDLPLAELGDRQEPEPGAR